MGGRIIECFESDNKCCFMSTCKINPIESFLSLLSEQHHIVAKIDQPMDFYDTHGPQTVEATSKHCNLLNAVMAR